MVKVIIRVVCVILAVCLIAGGFLFYRASSPEYALLKTISDVKKSGVDGLQEHLTAEARQTVDKAVEISNNAIVSGILSMVSGDDDKTGWLLSKLSEIEFTVEDVLKGKKNAKVLLGFSYGDTTEGTIELTMVRESMKWKIDGIGLPHFDSF